MKRTFLFFLVSFLAVSPFSAGQCEGSPAGGSYTQITQEEARAMMIRDDGHLIVDVRRQDEYDEGHIPGAVLVPNESIQDAPPEALPDRDQILLVYCRSGRRSKEASEKLAALGYTHVVEFGGIITWTGETVSTADEELIADDPFEAHEYGSPEDFYEDYGENFDDFEEAEEYYYEHGGW